MTNRGQWLAVGAIVAALGAALGAGISLSPDIRPIGPGSHAPDFAAANLTTGDSVRLGDYSGEVILLNIWATWCAPCEWEMPAIQRLHEALGPEGLKILAVSVDVGDSTDVLAWVRERGLTFEILHEASGRIQRLYQTTGVPETFVIDRHGVILKKHIGPEQWDSPAHLKRFAQLLGIDSVRTTDRPTGVQLNGSQP